MKLRPSRAGALIVALAALLAVGPALLGTQAAGASRGQQELPQGVAFTRLANAEIEVPLAPLYFGLARFTFGPGSQGIPETGGGPAVFFVESGTMTFYTGDAAAALQNQGATPAPDTGTTVEAGQQFAVPEGTLYASHNQGATEASVLRVVAFPAAAPPPGGAAFERLVYGVVTDLPPAPVTIEIDRVTILPGASNPLPTGLGATLIYVESGIASLTGPGIEAALTTAFVNAGTESIVRNSGGEPLVLLQVSLKGTAAGNGTPAATPAA